MGFSRQEYWSGLPLTSVFPRLKAGKDWRQEKGTTEDEMVGRNHWLDGHEFEQAPGLGDGQGSLGVFQSTGLQRVGHDWATWAELNLPWTARSNQSIPKEISPEYSLEALMLKLQYFGHLTWRTDSLEKTLMLAKIEGRRRRGWQRMRWLDGISNSLDMSLSRSWWWIEKPGVVQSMGSQRHMNEWLNWLKFWWRWEETRSFIYCLWKCKMAQLL